VRTQTPPTPVSPNSLKANRAPRAWAPPPLEDYERAGTLTPENLDAFAAAYWVELGNLAAACRRTGVRWRMALQAKRTEGPVRSRLLEIDALLAEEAHGAYMQRVLDPEVRSPAWLLFFLKNRDARYTEGLGKAGAVLPTVKDATFAGRQFAKQERALRVVGDQEAAAAR